MTYVIFKPLLLVLDRRAEGILVKVSFKLGDNKLLIEKWEEKAKPT